MVLQGHCFLASSYNFIKLGLNEMVSKKTEHTSDHEYLIYEEIIDQTETYMVAIIFIRNCFDGNVCWSILYVTIYLTAKIRCLLC